MADSWERLKQDCGACRGCALADTRTHVVFGDGCETAEIMLIGEGPGQHEDEQGIPFVGRAGQLLPQNRDPLNVEQDACIGYLRRQAALMKPKIIVCLGRIAAKAIIKEDFKITQEHGQWFQRGGVQMTAIYHPAALLRDEQKRPETFLDLKSIQAKVRELCEYTEC